MQKVTGSRAEIGLRVVLVIVGAVIAYQGIDNALGGISSLGLQGPTDFFTIVDQHAFQVRDSHLRFLGGVWFGVALVFWFGAARFRTMRSAVAVVCALAFVGGLARFSSMGIDQLIANGLAPALAAELFVLPLIGICTLRVGAAVERDRRTSGLMREEVA